MPIRQLDRAALKCEAKDLIRTARVSPIKMTLLLLAISLVLDLLDTALTYLTGSIVGVAFLSISFVGILITLISQVLSAGYCCYCLGVHRRAVVDAFRDPRNHCGLPLLLRHLEPLPESGAWRDGGA